MAKKVQYTTNDPSASTDYLAADNTWKPMSGGGGGVPTTRTLTINGTTQDLSADRTWTVGDMLKSVYDTDVDGVVDSAERIEIVVRNSTGSTLTKGQIVYLSGATGNRPNAVLAKADAEATSSKTIGMVTANIANNADGYIAVNGTLHDIDTSSFTAGDMLWLSATTPGGVVANTPPAEPNHTVFIGYVARVHPTQGRVVLAIQNGYELGELHGVEITTPSNGQVLSYNSTSGLWENSALTPSSVYIKNFTTYASVGSGSQILHSLLIPANTFTTGDILRFTARFAKSGTTTTSQTNIYINSSVSTSGASVIKANVYGTTTRASTLQASAVIINNTTETQLPWNATNLGTSEFVNSTSPWQSVAIDWTTNKYILFFCNPQASTDTVSLIHYLIEKL